MDFPEKDSKPKNLVWALGALLNEKAKQFQKKKPSVTTNVELPQKKNVDTPVEIFVPEGNPQKEKSEGAPIEVVLVKANKDSPEPSPPEIEVGKKKRILK